MFSRLLKVSKDKSFFLFGPRGTGKTSWVKSQFPKALYLDLLESSMYADLLANPGRLEELIPSSFNDWIVIDEVQKVPALLNEVHRLIESRKLRFVLTRSSARTLRRKGVNLLAGRALTYAMYPLTAVEMGDDFDLAKAAQYGFLPSIATEPDPKKYLESYIATYLREEVLQEGLIRNLGAFARFLETASFSQGSLLTTSEVARECASQRKTAEGYFDVLEDLLLSSRLPVFTKRAKRRMVSHPKFYFFDAGVYRAISPRGPLDSEEETMGAISETLFYQNLRAINDYYEYEYELYFWRTASNLEVDFILYGPRGLLAFEVKNSSTIHPKDLNGLKEFCTEYQIAQPYVIYGGSREMSLQGIPIIPLNQALLRLPELLK
jgi:predicted AAA+ superfamily ATPase